jgi:hypothetical protein
MARWSLLGESLVTDLTDADRSRLLTHVVIHGGENPHALQFETFERLTAAGLVTRTGDEDGGIEYRATPDGHRVAGAMLAAGRRA